VSWPALPAAPRSIWLCADDYGISPAVNGAIRELILRRRINATSVMVAAPHFNADEARALDLLNTGEKRAAVGLHVTLTAPFRPLSVGFAPLRDGCFPPLMEMVRLAIARRLRLEPLAIEVATQLRAFLAAFGRLPDFVDGHQHVHLFPRVRDAVLTVVGEAAPGAWVRQCGRARSWRRLHDRKQLVLDVLSVGFRRKAARRGISTNPAFAGAYDFAGKADYARLFPRFLAGLPDGGVIMCHPGFADAALRSLDPVTTQRETEFAFFDSDAFPQLLAKSGVTLARPGSAEAA
jgi:predicted glycoside hydrolase/deacetylase ChbG (UPF0249 family)